jgi:hypothetical protein
MYDVEWTNRAILVNVPDSPSWAKEAFEAAVEIWNQAQQWFVAKYEANHLTDFHFLEIDETGQIAQVTVTYVSQLPNGWGAETGDYGRLITIALSIFDGDSNPDMTPLAVHELGHVLGLGDNSIRGDIMWSQGPYPEYPSTLDLYGAYLQFLTGNGYGSQDSVNLPSQIQYETWFPNVPVPDVTLPEFPNIFVAFASSLFLIALVGKRIRDRRGVTSSVG